VSWVCSGSQASAEPQKCLRLLGQGRPHRTRQHRAHRFAFPRISRAPTIRSNSPRTPSFVQSLLAYRRTWLKIIAWSEASSSKPCPRKGQGDCGPAASTHSAPSELTVRFGSKDRGTPCAASPGPPAAAFDFRARFCHSAPMEMHAFGFRLWANASEGQKRFSISSLSRPRGVRPAPGPPLMMSILRGVLVDWNRRLL
jgi:hypothetical protein